MARERIQRHIFPMPAQLNHTIVHARDQEASARFYADILGLAAPRNFGPFTVVDTANGVSLDFMSTGDDLIVEHYAFLVSEAEWDEIFARITARGLDYWADPHMHQKNQFNRHDGGRGCYFKDPAGHILEIITRPYGSGS